MHPCKPTPTANVIGWGGRCFKPRFLSFFFFGLTGSWVWSDGFPLERLSWVYFCLLSFCPSFFLSFLCSLIVSFIVGYVCLSFFVLLSALCGFFLLCFCSVLLPLAVAHVVGGVSFAWVVMYVAVSMSLLLLRLASKKAREVPPCACVACFFFSLSRPLASCPHVCCCRACFCVDARARVATANFRLKLTVLLRRSPGDSSPSARLLLALCSSSQHLRPHG